MELSPVGLVRIFIKNIPLAVAAAVLSLYKLCASDKSCPQDLLTQLAVLFMRPILGTPKSLLRTQELLNHRLLSLHGPMWISKCIFRQPNGHAGKAEDELGAKEALLAAILFLACPDFQVPRVEYADVEAEWQAYRPWKSWLGGRRNVAEFEQYQHMMRSLPSDAPTILYFHGGAAW